MLRYHVRSEHPPYAPQDVAALQRRKAELEGLQAGGTSQDASADALRAEVAALEAALQQKQQRGGGWQVCRMRRRAQGRFRDVSAAVGVVVAALHLEQPSPCFHACKSMLSHAFLPYSTCTLPHA